MFDYDPRHYPEFVLPPFVFTLGEFPKGRCVSFKLRRLMPVHYAWLKYYSRLIPAWSDTVSISYIRFLVAFLVIEPRDRKIKTLTPKELLLLFEPCQRLVRHYRKQNFLNMKSLYRGEFLFSNN